ncbi:MAG: antitoxin [Firmicutes bacterium]|nr:antitoxin [Bacillota bacterium]
MADQIRRLVLQIPDRVVHALDSVVAAEASDRAAIVAAAVDRYLRERPRQELAELMAAGYAEMGLENLNIAAEAFVAESEAEQVLLADAGEG